ncbi:MAG TPA: FHA domain-containing protein [Planctomycetota bacterium]|nr:FHA domain-containing protein [Planctomycetota bacterium]
MQIKVTCRGGSRDGHIQECSSFPFSIGRAASNTLVFDAVADPQVSARHCEIIEQDGALFVNDLKSRNGTHLNGTRIEASARLHDGSVIRLGTTGPELHISIPAEAPEEHALTIACVSGSLAGKSFAFGREPITIGRLPESTIALDPVRDRFASGRHCELYFEDGQCWVRDTGSKHGTLLNGQKIQGAAPIVENSVLRLGNRGPEFVITLGGTNGTLRTLDSTLEKTIASPGPLKELNAPTNLRGSRGVHGTLEELGFSSLLMVLDMEKKSGELVLTQENARARLLLRKGRVTGASASGADVPAEAATGSETVYWVLSWTQGQFVFTQGDIDDEDTIKAPTTSLLMEGARRLDERRDQAAE